MNSLSANTVGGRSPLDYKGFVPNGEGISDVGNYTYSNFVKDLLYFFMIETLEDTNEYVIVPSEAVQAEEIQSCLNFGTSNNFLWVVQIGGTPLTYLEVVSPRVSEDLLRVYATDYIGSLGRSSVEMDIDVEVDKVVAELKESYTNNIVDFISTLQSLVTDKETFKPFGVAGLGEEKSSLLDNKHYLKFKISFSKFLLTLDKLGLRPIGVWHGRSGIRLFNPSGFDNEPLQDVRVNHDIDCIFVKGIHLKRTTIRDYSEDTQELT